VEIMHSGSGETPSDACKPERSRSRLLPPESLLVRASRTLDLVIATASDSLLCSNGEDSALLRKLNQARSASAMNDVDVA
jgi:hypothetical protein